jgi:predicted ribosome quality control (RQC) complex YloA/Tae2 family protein
MAVGLDSFGVTFLARELNGMLGGRAVGSIALKDDRLLIILFDGKERVGLLFLAEPTLPLLCAVRKPELGQGPAHPPRLEERLRGATVKDVCQIDLDRIIMLTLEAGSGKRLRLYFELVPPFPNMFLTDWEDTVIEPLFKAGTRTRRRVLQRREAYVPPPVQDKTHPIDVTPQKLAALDWRHDPEALSKGITGVSPLLSREMVNRAAKQGSLYEVFNRMLQTYRKARITPTVFTAALPISKSPPHRGLAWFRPTVEGVSSPVAVGSLNDAVVVVLGDFLESSALQTRRAATLRALDREIRK